MQNSIDVVQNRRMLSVDGLGRRPTAKPVHRPLPPQRRVQFTPRPAPKEHRLWQKLQLSLLLMAGATGGFFADNLFLGLILLTGYGIFSFVTHISSRVTFTLALLLLAAISLMLLVKPSAQLISNFSTYAFVLLLIGVITLGKEARMPKRMRRKYRR